MSAADARAPSFWTLPFVIAFAANLLHGMGVLLTLHLPGLLERWGEDRFVIGLVVAALALGAIAVRPFAGRAMDGRVGRRGVAILGGVLHVLACAGYLAVDRVGPLLWVVRVLHGLGGGAIFSSLFTAAADLVPVSRRVEGLASFGVSGMLPIALGGFVGDLVLSIAGFRELFFTMLGCASAALVISLALPETGAQRGLDAVQARARAAEGLGFFGVVVQRDLMPVWMIGISFASALGATFAFLANFVLEEHVGSVGLFYGWYAAVAITLRLTVGWIPDRYGAKRVLAPSLVFIAMALGALSMARGSLVVGLAGAFAGIGHGFAFPILSGLTAGRARDADRGSAMSIFTAIFDAGLLVAGPLFGVLSDLTSLRTTFVVAAVVPLVGGVVFYAWDGRVRAGAPRAS